MRPTTRSDRLPTLDVLRGFALLGILVINVRYFALPLRSLNDPSFPSGELEPRNLWTWLAGTLLFEDKMIAIFSMLFGAGLLLMAMKGLWRQVLRLVWLFGFGLLHAYGLWFGDILMVYAFCGILLLPLQRVPAGVTATLGIVCVLAASGFRTVPALDAFLSPEGTQASILPVAPPEESEGDATGEATEDSADDAPQESDEDDAPAATAAETDSGTAQEQRRAAWNRVLEGEAAAHAGSYGELYRWRRELVGLHQFAGFTRFDLWRCGGFILIGMALMRLRFLTGRQNATVYAGSALCALVMGLALTALGMVPQLASILGRDAELGDLGKSLLGTYGSALRIVGSGFTALGWISVVLLLCRSELLVAALKPVAAVGRMALSNYLLQTLACVVIFEGFGMGRWGQLDAFAQIKLVGGILAAQLVLSSLWLAIFNFGPAEWVWRSLTYLQLQPILARTALEQQLADEMPL